MEPLKQIHRVAGRRQVSTTIAIFSSLLLINFVQLSTATDQNDQQSSTVTVPLNHKAEEQTPQAEGGNSRRTGRQYDAPMSTSGTGNYASVAGDAGAYLNSALGAGSAGGGSNGMLTAAYGSADPSAYASTSGQSYHHDRGYPAGMHSPAMGAYGQPPMGPFGMGGGGGGGSALASMFPGSSSGFPLLASKGFDIAEIVCTAIAVAIGAVIVGAPFILLYLFVMNQMQGNGPTAMGPGGGSISLTGPTANTNVGGRKKRHTSFPEALLKQLSPLINNEQVAQSFKMLMNSIAKYQV